MNYVYCCYFWKEEDEDRPQCHWVRRCPDDFPPCEEDEDCEEDEYYE